MSKGNLFLGFGRGAVGDVVFSRQSGEQVARARNRSPRNPQTPLQLLQRVVMKTSSQGFSLMQDICNHSFQGYDGVTANQARFNVLNVAAFRLLLADIINSGDPAEILTSSETNFSERATSIAPINPYIVSEGKITAPATTWGVAADNGAFLCFTDVLASGTPLAKSYQQFIDGVGCQRGDQITTVVLTCDDTEDGASGMFNGFHYGRFICEPADGDMTASIFDSTKWNPKNENVRLTTDADDTIAILPSTVKSAMCPPAQAYSVCAMAYIISREVGGVWTRSSASLSVRPWTVGSAWHLSYDHGTMLLSDAIASYMSDAGSLLYLNQAE